MMPRETGAMGEKGGVISLYSAYSSAAIVEWKLSLYGVVSQETTMIADIYARKSTEQTGVRRRGRCLTVRLTPLDRLSFTARIVS